MSTPDAAELHRLAVHEGDRGRYGSARVLLRKALAQGPDASLRAHILLSLSYYEAEHSHLRDGLLLLDEAAAVPDLSDRLRGLVASQRGLLYQRAGLPAQSLAAFDVAARLLDEEDGEDRARVLLNRGILHLDRGARREARADFTACRDLARRHGLDLMAAKAAHNLGYAWFLYGDLPRALREMDAVTDQLGTQSPMFAAVYYSDRALVLRASGLWAEADEDLARASMLFREARVPLEQAATDLTRARVALDQQQWASARRLANGALRRFRTHGAGAWPLLADLVKSAADLGAGRRLQQTADAAAQLQESLLQLGLPEEARGAALLTAAAALRLNDPGRARLAAGPAIRLRRDDSLRMRLLARSVRAALAAAEGRESAVSTELLAASRELHRYQASFGSWDLQTAVSAHGRPLAEWALRRALRHGRPGDVFAWAERTRALSSRLAPVVPPDDPVAADLLEDLRDARTQLRATDPGDSAADRLRGQCLRIERALRQRWWHAPGQQERLDPAPLRDVRPSLAAVDGTLVAHLVSDGQLFALVVRPQRQAIVPLGAVEPVLELRQRVRADLDTLAVLRPGAVREVVKVAHQASLRHLETQLWQPLHAMIGEGPLLLAPSAELATMPWTSLPALVRRPLTVVASVTAWLVGLPRSQSEVRADRAPTVVATLGPGLVEGRDEVEHVAATWPDAVTLLRATPADVLRAAGTADILHVAAHGAHARGNALFSHLDLYDGSLFGHELQRLPQLPGHVMLSACELGQTDVRAGGEPLGMAASLLHAGAGSVVAAVAKVADHIACRVAVAHHEHLSQGLPPAIALTQAIAETNGNEPAPFVCFGSGW